VLYYLVLSLYLTPDPLQLVLAGKPENILAGEGRLIEREASIPLRRLLSIGE
jgi:hypothetical protein